MLAQGCCEKFSTSASENSAREPEIGIGKGTRIASRGSGSMARP